MSNSHSIELKTSLGATIDDACKSALNVSKLLSVDVKFDFWNQTIRTRHDDDFYSLLKRANSILELKVNDLK